MKKWVYIDEKYLNGLRRIESRIPYSDYGNDKFKPFFSPLFQIGELSYVTQVSSPKDRHRYLNEQKDFKKIYDLNNNLMSVINLNYMFPVPTSILKTVNYRDIDQYRTFKNDDEKSAYIQLLRLELSIINSKNFDQDAKYIYNLKYDKPNNVISRRCLDFKSLEIFAKEYLEKQKELIAV